jgi:hypothetical protein
MPSPEETLPIGSIEQQLYEEFAKLDLSQEILGRIYRALRTMPRSEHSKLKYALATIELGLGDLVTDLAREEARLKALSTPQDTGGQSGAHQPGPEPVIIGGLTAEGNAAVITMLAMTLSAEIREELE